MNDEQRAYVRDRLLAGAGKEEMVQYLLAEGVDEGTAVQNVSDIADNLVETGTAVTDTKLPSICNLLAKSWQFVVARIDLVGWYVVISLVPVVAFIIIGVLISLANTAGVVAFSLVGLFSVAAVIVTIWFSITASAGLVYAVIMGGDTRFKDGFNWARPLFWQIVLVSLLVGLVLLASAIAFTIPALIVSVYIAFSFLEFVRHERRGLHALAASTHLVYGRFWPVALRVGVMVLIIMVVNIILKKVVFGFDQEYATAFNIIGEVIALVIGFFLSIMFVRYIAELHSALTAQSTPYVPHPLSQSYKVYRFLAWIGGLILSAMIIGILVTVVNFMF